MVASSNHVVSDRKIQANRLNAQRSTGPRSADGKGRAARNAVTHGVYCRDLVLNGESQAAFDALRDGVVADLRPRTTSEAVIVEQFVAASWKLRRIRAAEREMYAEHARDEHAEAKQNADIFGDPPPPPFDPAKETAAEALAAVVAWGKYEKLARLEERLERTLHRCLRELRLLRKDAAERAEVEEEDVADGPPQPNEQNEPTEAAAEARRSTANDVIVRNEATGGGTAVAQGVVATSPARPGVARATSDDA